MLKKMNNMNIKGRLNYVFRLIIIAFSVVAVVISAMMILYVYGLPQGAEALRIPSGRYCYSYV